MLLVCWNWHGVCSRRGGRLVSGGSLDTFCFSLLALPLLLLLLLLLLSFLAVPAAPPWASLIPLSFEPAPAVAAVAAAAADGLFCMTPCCRAFNCCS